MVRCQVLFSLHQNVDLAMLCTYRMKVYEVHPAVLQAECSFFQLLNLQLTV